MILDHPIFNSIDQDLVKKVELSVNKVKVNKSFHKKMELNDEEIKDLKQVLEALELATIDLWDYSFDTKEENAAKKRQFKEACYKYFKLIELIPVPKDNIPKMKHVLKLITFAYLGEKWEDMRQFLKENSSIWEIDQPGEEKWNEILFTNIYLATLNLIKKESWEDLSKSMKLIADLRDTQKKVEQKFFENLTEECVKSSALEIASLYHLAKGVDLIGQYMLKGTPSDILEQLDFHFEKSISYTQQSFNVELELILIMLQNTFKKMIFNSVWYITKTVNSRVTKFVERITKSNKPIFELLYPQRMAILEKGLLNPANKAIVVNLPTSSGKTLIAEFRILQALNQFSEEKGWIAYVAPTKSLVNQITARLQKDLGGKPLNIKVEKIGGALEIDAFEENMISSTNQFDILVTTPEKLSLLIRQDIEKKLGRPLVLAVIDEAHNLASEQRGLSLELLLSIIKKDCDKANLVLLTPFIPNSRDIATWLDPQNPQSINIELNWQPTPIVIGTIYATGERRNIKLWYDSLVTTKSIKLDDPILVSQKNNFVFPIGQLKKTKYKIATAFTQQLLDNGNILLMSRTVTDCWKMAKLLSKTMPDLDNIDENIILVNKFIAAELGENFPLISYLKKGIGVHNAGLPDDIKYLMEWLMEEGLLKVLVATTTIAQGINFPVSTILMASCSYPWTKKMPSSDFWNLVGRTGRIDQKSLGVIGIACEGKGTEDEAKIISYVAENTENLTSVLVTMVEDTLKLRNELNLKALFYQPEWSAFLQYISHMYRQSQNLQNFLSDVELTLKRTYGYNMLDPEKKQILLNSVKSYARSLDENKHLSTLSDQTGFSPETIELAMRYAKGLNIEKKSWAANTLFSGSEGTLRKLMGLLLKVPEVKENLSIKIKGNELTHSTLARIISDWVSGKELKELSKTYFGGEDTEAVTKCVTSIYSKVSGSATWGVSAIQKMPGSGINFEKLTQEEKNKINNLPAMIFYGVNTDEGILMRTSNIPRQLANNLGKLYKDQTQDIYTSKPSEVANWLKKLDAKEWDKAIPKGKNITGEEYKILWEKIAGI